MISPDTILFLAISVVLIASSARLWSASRALANAAPAGSQTQKYLRSLMGERMSFMLVQGFWLILLLVPPFIPALRQWPYYRNSILVVWVLIQVHSAWAQASSWKNLHTKG